MVHRQKFSHRQVWIGACALALLLGGSLAHAEPSRAKPKQEGATCASALKVAQQKQQSGRLVEASLMFAKCSVQSCGIALWQACTSKNTQLYAALPSVVPVVSEEGGGEPRVDIQVKMDGQLIASQIDGRAVPVDPGTHEFTFSTESGVFASETITIAKGEHNRPVAVSLSSGAKAPVSSASEK